MKNIQIYIWYYAILLLFSACIKKDNHLAQALEVAGKNRNELLKVLNYYKNNDSLKYEAARFLIENMPFYGFSEGEELYKYLRYFEAYSKTKKTAQEVIDSIQEVDGIFNKDKLTYKYDIETVDSFFLVNHIEWAFKVWREQPWGKNIAFNDFCEYILPYRIGDEPLSLWREELYQKYNPMLEKFRSSIKSDNPMHAAQILLDTLKANDYHYTGLFPQGPSIGPITLQWNSGSCREFADGIVYILRSVGIPCGIDKALQRGDANAPHFWNFTLDHNHQTYMIELPEQMEWKLASEYISPKGKTYRETYSINRNIIQKLANKSHIWPTFKSPFFKDVTDEYAGNRKRVISITTKDLNISFDKNELIYLCLANKQDWHPIDFTFLKKDTIRFDNVEGGVVGMLTTWDGNELVPLSDPFLVDKTTDKLHFFTVRENTHTVILYEKYHLAPNPFFKLMLNGVIEGSNNKKFRDADTLHLIKSIPYRLYTVVNLKSDKSYQYVRYRGENWSRCNIAELAFYEDIPDSLHLEGNIIGTPGAHKDDPRYEYTNVFDGDPNTSFNYKEYNGGWVGLDLGEQHKIKKIIYTPRNNINFIYKGDRYELFYWDKKHWNSLGQQVAMADSLVYIVPRNALLYLKNHSHGKDERIFEYKDGKQRFW